MKELKFRAWELSEKRMWAHHEIDFSDTNGIVMWGELFANPSKQGFAPLMQFTGLRDKNGREIYEGDILRFRSYREQVQKYELVGEVRYSEWGCYCVDEIRALRWEGFHGWVTPPTINYFMNRPGQEWEVIGNIYENPELLKDATPKGDE